MLQFAFRNQFKPVAFAQFWWGASPLYEVRHHGYFYPACRGRCKPILEHVLSGMDVEDDPLPDKLTEPKTIEIVYQDETIVVINKTADLLSVPGSKIERSVYSELKQQFPNATGPLIVHRLDMATSGLLVIALTKDVHKHLQQQFINRKVGKRYLALLGGILDIKHGVVDLPIRVDLDDRPRQVVCYEYDKPAVTEWQVIECSDGKTRVYFYPKTGRSHQLRMHSAHLKGLNCSIVGDELYGKPADRLYLHAEWLQLKHPDTGEVMAFQAKAPF